MAGLWTSGTLIRAPGSKPWATDPDREQIYFVLQRYLCVFCRVCLTFDNTIRCPRWHLGQVTTSVGLSGLGAARTCVRLYICVCGLCLLDIYMTYIHELRTYYLKQSRDRCNGGSSVLLVLFWWTVYFLLYVCKTFITRNSLRFDSFQSNKVLCKAGAGLQYIIENIIKVITYMSPLVLGFWLSFYYSG